MDNKLPWHTPTIVEVEPHEVFPWIPARRPRQTYTIHAARAGRAPARTQPRAVDVAFRGVSAWSRRWGLRPDSPQEAGRSVPTRIPDANDYDPDIYPEESTRLGRHTTSSEVRQKGGRTKRLDVPRAGPTQHWHFEGRGVERWQLRDVTAFWLSPDGRDAVITLQRRFQAPGHAYDGIVEVRKPPKRGPKPKYGDQAQTVAQRTARKRAKQRAKEKGVPFIVEQQRKDMKR
jgi:hypothetical protein